MFLDNLSAAVLRLCEKKGLSYEAASERCALSSRYFGDIARGRTAPSVVTLEKLCLGFGTTPNDLLLLPSMCQESAYRRALLVTQVRRFPSRGGFAAYSVCPRCGVTLEREYQQYCDRCGQRLDWSFPFLDGPAAPEDSAGAAQGEP